MLTARLAIATTSFEAEAESEKGFEGRLITAKSPGLERSCRCRVESHDAEMRRLCAAEYRMLRTPWECVEMTVCAPEERSILSK